MSVAPKIAERNTLADQALADADCQTLRRMYAELSNDLQSILNAISVMSDQGKTHPLITPEPVLAMRDVALAAIQLARDVALREKAKP